MTTLLEILQKTTAYLAGKGVTNPKLNAELLLAHVLKLRRLDLYLQFDRPLAAEQLDALRPLVQRRGKREPLEYIVGNRPFADIDLLCDRRALVPRSETEELVELLATRFSGTPTQQAANGRETLTTGPQASNSAERDTTQQAANRAGAQTTPPQANQCPAPARVLDLGTGTGALALALAKIWPQTVVTAVDASAEALALAGANARHNHLAERVTFICGNWFAPLEGGRFDLIVSNPPYLTEAEWHCADPEVKDYEPYGALVAPEDGLADLRQIVLAAPPFLAAGGLLALETGIGHHAALAQIATASGAYEATESHCDSDGRPRFFVARARQA